MGKILVTKWGDTLVDLRLIIAIEVMQHLAIATAMPDGEDSAGRQKLRLLTPSEVVARALSIAECLYDLGMERGYITENPKEGD